MLRKPDFEPGERYSPTFCKEVLSLASEDPQRFLQMTKRFAKNVTVDEVRRSMTAWDIFGSS